MSLGLLSGWMFPEPSKSSGRRRSEDFRTHCQVECWELGARRELSKTSTLASVPGVLCLPMVLSNHHSAAMERAKVPQIQVLLYIQGLGVQGVQEAPVVP